LSNEGLKSEQEKREFLNQVVTRIDVTLKNKKEHIFDIHFKLPIVGDKYRSTKKNRVTGGKRTQTLIISTV
jgi:hypothetical protein